MSFKKIIFIVILFMSITKLNAQTTALWTFDEQEGLYPSSVLSDISDNDYPLVIGLCGKITLGKYGNALSFGQRPDFTITPSFDPKYGLVKMKPKPGNNIEPLSWYNADFCALMTEGESHLRKEVGFKNPTQSKLNIGQFDWTIEFWYEIDENPNKEEVIFEIGSGPRGENNSITRLFLSQNENSFFLFNQPSESKLSIPTTIKKGWHHFAFVYSSSEKQLKHFVDGKLQELPMKAIIKSLPEGKEAYLSIGTTGLWKNPISGKLDELCFSEGEKYKSEFKSPDSFSPLYNNYKTANLKKGPPLLFDKEIKTPIELNDRKYLFIDDAIVKESKDIKYCVNPPRYFDRVIPNIEGAFRKHINVVEDDSGYIRLYMGIADDYLGVLVSKDGKNFEAPNLVKPYKGFSNVVIAEPSGMGMTFIDPNAPSAERWKYISDYHRRGIYLWTSPDGYNFTRLKTAVLPFRAGSQSNIYYDDQKQEYASFHRTDMGATQTGDTERDFVMTLAKDVKRPWDFKPLNYKEELALSKTRRTHSLIPWYLDNGPLTPGGFGLEFPWIFTPREGIDPEATDIYVPKAHKYEYASDTYLAFPVIYFHYEDESNDARYTLFDEKRNLGSGPTDIQLEVSRDGVNWKRYPRPTYIPIGNYSGDDVKQVFIAQGMIRRGDEIWQYFFGDTKYHSPYTKDNDVRGVYRVVQRFDGFVSADSPYEKEALLVTKPLIFKGDRLLLNINTSASGYAQVGLLDEAGNPIEGYELDNCVYINGDFISTEVEWLKKGTDLSNLQGKVVQLQFRMRGSKLYSMQFSN